ncbi:unnamed protein product [Linum tenue]|uniref:Uncharacterized protein n=1 Tax=Linum tenue TaxID=586396 RepID=A0AAV0PUE1_9ROSI|nr:unnamed protein product [Linum tenue]
MFVGFRRRWCFLWLRDQFAVGMLTTQASESCNAQVRLLLKMIWTCFSFTLAICWLKKDARRLSQTTMGTIGSL